MAEYKEITIEDVREWQKKIERTGIKSRQYSVFRYCPHQERFIDLSVFGKGCSICLSKILGQYINDKIVIKHRSEGETSFSPDLRFIPKDNSEPHP